MQIANLQLIIVMNILEILFIIFLILLKQRVLVIISLLSVIILLAANMLYIFYLHNIFTLLFPLYFNLFAMFFSRFVLHIEMPRYVVSRKMSSIFLMIIFSLSVLLMILGLIIVLR